MIWLTNTWRLCKFQFTIKKTFRCNIMLLPTYEEYVGKVDMGKTYKNLKNKNQGSILCHKLCQTAFVIIHIIIFFKPDNSSFGKRIIFHFFHVTSTTFFAVFKKLLDLLFCGFWV